MLIKDLKKDYPLVYQAALENQYKQSRSRNDKIPLLESVKGGNFTWEHSSEGHDFWSHIYNEEFEEAKELCPHLFEDAKFKPKFEVGKWYKGWGVGGYAKFKELSSLDHFYFTEKINIGIHHKKTDWWANHSGIEEASLEEIQEFLPDGHPDKFKTQNESEMTIKEIQQLCKEKYPIGCIYKDAQYKDTNTLLKDDTTYTLGSVSNSVLAHSGGGCLYKEGKWAEVISLPEEKPKDEWIPKKDEWIVSLNTTKDYKKNSLYRIERIEGDGCIYCYNTRSPKHKMFFRKAELHEIPKEEPNFPTIALDEFPTEGAYNGLDLLPYLEHKFPNNTKGSVDKTDAKGIAWSTGSYWFVKGDKTSSKTYYNYGQLQKFIKEGQGFRQPLKDCKPYIKLDPTIISNMTTYCAELLLSNPKKKSYETTVNLVTTDYQLKKKKKRSVLSI
jgi:hypothetical protein